jgi:hypothetical protein
MRPYKNKFTPKLKCASSNHQLCIIYNKHYNK